MGLFGGLVNTWKDGYQFGDLLKSVLYDLNPIAWAGDALAHIGDKDFNFFENNPNWTPSNQDPIHQGIVNTWNKMTGNSHLTPEYQHEEQMEMNKNQITANDIQKAGISKYALSPVGFSAPSTTGKGGDMLQAVLATQQIASQAQALKEQKYNYNVSKKLGIRTGDTNALAQYMPLIKILTGKDLSDIPVDGLLGWLKDTFFPVSSDSNIVNSASSDVPFLFGAKTVGSNVGGKILGLSGSPLADVLKAGFKFDPKKSLPAGKSATELPRSDTFDLDNAALRIHHESFYEEIGQMAKGQARPLSASYMNKLVSKYVTELKKEGFAQDHAIGIVRAWLDKEMSNLGYEFDKTDNMWYYTGR